MITTRKQTGTTPSARVGTERGFTLIELLTAMAVAGIVGMYVVPALDVFAANAALRGTAYDLMAAMTRARSEAVKHSAEVIVCHSEDPMAASPACGGTDGDWSKGWLVFVSKDGDGDYDDGTDLLLGAGSVSGQRTRVLANATAASSVEFRADGSLAATAVAALAVCDQRGEPAGKRLDLAMVGRPALKSATQAAPLPTCNPGG